MEENREITFYSDASRNYMVLRCPPETRDNYQYKMLAANQIDGLLSCSSRTIDSQDYLYYDITSRQSLTDLYDRRRVRAADLRNLLEGLVKAGDTLTEYLLDSAHLLTDPECIYVDFREQSYSFTYYPGEAQTQGLEALFTFLADRIEGSDRQAAALIYRLCMMAEKPGFRLQKEMLEELGVQVISRRGNPVQTFPEKGAAEYAGAGPSFTQTFSSPGFSEPPTYMEADPQTRDRRIYTFDPYGEEDFFNRRTGRESEGAGRKHLPEADLIKTTETSEHAGKSGMLILLGISLILAGFLLFLMHHWIYLEERGLLLSRALGGIMTAAGVTMTVSRVIRKVKSRNTDRAAAENRSDRRETMRAEDLWEDGWLPGEENGEIQTMHADMDSMRPSVYSLNTEFSKQEAYRPRYAEETSFLGKDPGLGAGLYGTGSYRGEQIILTDLPCVVGKMREYVDQVLGDASVSRMHARFARDAGGRMTVRDLNSTNGTWLNGERLQPNESRPIEPGDHVRLGRMEFVYR